MDTTSKSVRPPISQSLARFCRYTTIGMPTFLFDLYLLFVLTSIVGLSPVTSAGISFFIAISLNYSLSKHYVFKDTTRGTTSTYLLFLLIGGIGLFLVTSLMYVCVEMLGWNYMISRILIAVIVGFWNYFMNLRVNFRV